MSFMPGKLAVTGLMHRAGFVFFIAAFFLGCGHTEIKRVEQTTELNQEIPVELRAKFAVEPTEKTVSKSEEKQLEKTKTAEKKSKKDRILVKATMKRPDKDAFQVGERLVYRVSFFGVSAGNFFPGNPSLQGTERPQGLSLQGPGGEQSVLQHVLPVERHDREFFRL
jgi:hypothetical protein